MFGERFDDYEPFGDQYESLSDEYSNIGILSQFYPENSFYNKKNKIDDDLNESGEGYDSSSHDSDESDGESVVIDYDDEISINIKDEGKREVMKDVEKSFSQDNIKVSEVLGFNNINYTINKC